jgi:hypothetical protein
MRPRRVPGPERLDIRSLADGEEVVAYRIVRTEDRDHSAFERSFTSRAALGLPPRRGTPEERHPELADGLSAYRSREAAMGTALSLIERDRSVGEYIAKVVLRGGMGVRIAVWGPPGHLTIWGNALTLCQATVDIEAVSSPEEVPEDEVPDPRQHG